MIVFAWHLASVLTY